MKITKTQLKQIIKEELGRVLGEKMERLGRALLEKAPVADFDRTSWERYSSLPSWTCR